MLCWPFICQAQSSSASDYSQFIAEQKAKEETITAPYKEAVTELTVTAEKNAQAPDIQAYIKQLKTNSLAREKGTASISTADTSGQILIFVSSSMPKTSLIQWMIQAQKIKAPLIIRGFVSNSALDTKTWVKELMEQNNKQGGVQINPVAFERFNIQQVPAVVATSRTFQCPPDMSCMTPAYDVVYGNVSLEQALKTISEQGDSATKIALQGLTALRGRS